jgi:hypothetical protein
MENQKINPTQIVGAREKTIPPHTVVGTGKRIPSLG